jgi:hypothetical protein
MFQATSAHHQEFSLYCTCSLQLSVLLPVRGTVLLFTTKQCHGQAAKQITGGCMYSREKTPDDERMSLKTC